MSMLGRAARAVQRETRSHTQSPLGRSRRQIALCLGALVIVASLGLTTATASSGGAPPRAGAKANPVVCSVLRSLGSTLPSLRFLLDSVALALGCTPPATTTTSTSTTTTTTTPPDPNADRDSDDIPDDLERRIGTAPTLVDTDGDGLTDTFEILDGGPEHSPFEADTTAMVSATPTRTSTRTG